jgi:hypothetical protein
MSMGTQAGTDDDPAKREAEIVRSFSAVYGRPYRSPESPAYKPRPPAVIREPPAPPGRERPERPAPEGTSEPARPAIPPERRSPAVPARRGDRLLLDLGALAVGVCALVQPWAWLIVVVVAAVAAATARSLTDHGPGWGPLLGRATHRVGSWLRPRSLATLPVLATRVLLVAVAVTGAAAGARWLVAEGWAGTIAAARAGAWAHGFRAAAVVVCVLVVSGIGEARSRRAAAVRGPAARLGAGGTGALAVVMVALVVGAVLWAPRLGAGWPSGDDGLGWAPARLRDNLDRILDDLVTTELDATASCLASRQHVGWRVAYTGGNPPGDIDVARLTAPDGPVPPSALATAAAAAHNQLAPWVERLEIAQDDTVMLALDRTELPAAIPADDAADLAGATVTGGDVLADAAHFDRRLALRCSVGPVP